MVTVPTAQAILNTAQDLCQCRGFNGFSYRDIAEKLGIKTASIHYHFATKAELGEALIVRYRGEFAATLAAISAEVRDPIKRLQRFSESLGKVLRSEGKLCLCSMFASELQTLDPSMQSQVRGFFEDAELWLENVFREGREAGVLSYSGSPRSSASAYLASLQGLAMWARVFADPARFESGSQWLSHGLEA